MYNNVSIGADYREIWAKVQHIHQREPIQRDVDTSNNELVVAAVVVVVVV